MKWELMSMIFSIRLCPLHFHMLLDLLWGCLLAPPRHLQLSTCPRSLSAFRQEGSEQGLTWRTLITCTAFLWELVERKWKSYLHVETLTETVIAIGIEVETAIEIEVGIEIGDQSVIKKMSASADQKSDHDQDLAAEVDAK